MRIFLLLGLMLFPGCWAANVTGPEMVHGPSGGSVTVQCWYETGYEGYPKYWCQGGGGAWLCSSHHLAETKGTEAEVKRGRVSIRDNHTLTTFTVTMQRLTAADNGTYLCGIRRDRLLDPTHAVEVFVSQDVPHRRTRRPPSRPNQPSSAPLPEYTFTWTHGWEGQPNYSANQPTTSSGSQLINVHFLMLVLWKVPIFLSIIGVNIW